MGNRIIISVTNDLSSDQRVHRVSQTLNQEGWKVLLVGRKKKNSIPLEKRDYETHRMNLFFEKGKLFYLEYNLRLFFFLLRKKTDFLLSNDLDSLLANYLVSRLRSKELVYDSHEYFTQVPELVHRPLSQKIWITLEKALLPRIKRAYTVNASFANIYNSAYGIEMGVVRNVPFSKEFPPKSKKESRMIVYQGAINVGRGLELMIDSMEYLPGFQLHIAGGGDILNHLKDRVKKKNLSDRVTFEGFIPFEKLHQLTQQAWLGLSLEEPLGENYRLSLPNKIFDYIQSGVPMITSDLPEVKNIINTHQVGITLKETEKNPKNLAQIIQNLSRNEMEWQEMYEACKKASRILCWENEKKELLKYFVE